MTSYSPNTSTADSTYYRLQITNSCGTLTSNTVKVKVNAQTAISTQPDSAKYCLNTLPANVIPLKVVTSGSKPTGYQWYSNTVNNTTNGTVISGATASTYTPPTNVAGQKFYYVVVTGPCNTVTSVARRVTTLPDPSVSIASSGTPVCQVTSGNPATVTITNNSSYGVSVNYTINGGAAQNVTINANSSATLNVSNTPGTYNYAVTNVSYTGTGMPGCTKTLSGVSTSVTVNALPTLSATKTDVQCKGETNGSVTLTSDGTSFSKDNINWQASKVFSGLAAGTYTFYAKNASGCSRSVQVTITEPATKLNAVITSDNLICGATTTTVTMQPKDDNGNNLPIANFEYGIYNTGTGVIQWQTNNVFTNVPSGPQTYYMRLTGNVNSCNFIQVHTPQSSCVSIVKSFTTNNPGDNTKIAAVGQKITFTFTITNSSTPVYDVVVTDSKLGYTGTAFNLAANEVKVITIEKTVTQADLDACTFTNKGHLQAATSSGGTKVIDVYSNEVVVNVASAPSWTLTKSADKSKFDAIGNVINYTLVLKNTGNITISNVNVSDPGHIIGTPAKSINSDEKLDPNEEWTYTYSYTVTQNDYITKCDLINTASASGAVSCGAIANITSNTITVKKEIKVPTISTADIIHPTCELRTGSVLLKGTPNPGTFYVTAYELKLNTTTNQIDTVFYRQITRTDQSDASVNLLKPGVKYVFKISQPGGVCYSNATAAVTMNNIQCIIAYDDMNQVPKGMTAEGNVFNNDRFSGPLPTITSQYFNSAGVLTSLTLGVETTIYNEQGVEAGKMTLNSNGSYVFVPKADYTGLIPIKYTITESGQTEPQSSSAFLSIDIAPLVKTGTGINNPPVANKDTYAIEQGQTATVQLLINDSDPDKDNLYVTKASNSINNQLTTLPTSAAAPLMVVKDNFGVEAGTAWIDLSNGHLVFNSYPNYYGSVSFKYTIRDRSDANATDVKSDSAFVQIVVLLKSTSNLVVANDDANAAPKGVKMTGNIITNDYKSDNNTQSLTVTSAILNNSTTTINISETTPNVLPGIGTLLLKPNGEYEFTPIGQIGTTTIQYTTCDNSTPQKCDHATLYLTSLETDTKFWTGIISDQFEDGRNWTSGVLPSNGDNITFATQTNSGYDTHSNMEIPSREVIIHNLTNETDDFATVVSPYGSLIITGTVIGSHDNPNKLVVKTVLPGEQEGLNGTLIVTDGCNKGILGTVEFLAKGYEGEESTWTDNFPGSPDNNGTTSFTTKYHWQFFGIPVKSVAAFPTFTNAIIQKYNEAYNGDQLHFYQKWELLTGHSTLTAFAGYEITHAKEDLGVGETRKLYRISGELNFCDQTLTLTRNAPKVTGASGVNEHYGLGQNLFGNSYTSAIQISKMNFDPALDKTVYLYNTGRFHDWATTTAPSDQTAYVAGNYLAIPVETGNVVWDDQIPSMQGFLLKFLPEESTTSKFGEPSKQVTLTYDTTALTQNTQPQLIRRKSGTTGTAGFQPAGKTPFSYLRVNLASKSTVDNLWLFSQQGTSDKFDNGWDGRKSFGTPTAFIYTQTADGPMQVNTNKTIDGTPITFYANGDTDYTLTLVKSNLGDYEDLHLIDFATKTVTPLTAETTKYNFKASNKGSSEKRFLIVNKPGSQIDLNNGGFDMLAGYITPDKVLTAINYTGEGGTMQLYSITGSLIMSQDMTTGTNRYQTTLSSGAYIMVLKAADKQSSIKVLIK